MNIKKHSVLIILLAFIIIPALDSRSEIPREKKQEIADKLYNIELSGGDHLGYCSELLQHLEKSANIRPSKYKGNYFDDIDRLNERGGNLDLYSLLSGGLAIRESLQLESIRPSDEGMRDINLSSLKPVDVRSHPFEKMLLNRTWKIYPLDKFTPEDFYYIHFTNAHKAINIFNHISATGGAIYNRFSPASVDFKIKEKILTQLGLPDTTEHAAFYANGISEVVITGSDPFIMEGSDVTLIIRQGQSLTFSQAVSGMRKQIKERHPVKETEILISGYKVSHIYTDDRQVWSFFLTLTDGTVVISNSIKAASRVIDTFSGSYPSLSEAADYRYMRSIYPAGKDNEDGFFYLSDKFIRHLVSPELRIKEARRLYEGMKLSVLEKYVIFHYQLTGRFPATIEEVMVSAGGPSMTDPRKKELDSLKGNHYYSKAAKLESSDISDWNSFRTALTPPKSKVKKKKKKGQSPDDFIYDLKMFYKKITGCQAYTPAEVLGMIESVSKPGGLDSKRFSGLALTPDSFQVKSELYGRTGFMKPLIELETGTISKREAEEYRKFAEEYGSFWKDYFDPIGIRIKTEPVLTIETCILPLINNSLYNMLAGISGGTPVDLHPDSRINGDTLSAAFKVNPLMISSLLTLSGMGDLASPKSVSRPEDIFTGEIQFHMGDALPLADFDPAILGDIFSNSSVRSSEVLTGFLAWSFFHPVRIALPVKKTSEGMILINTVINRFLDKSSLSNYMQSESYIFSYNKTDVRVLKLTFFSSLITRFYMAEKDNVLHITSTEKYMKEILDMKQDTPASGVKANAAVVYRPSAMVLERDVYSAGIIENGLQKSRKNNGMIKLMGMLFPDADSKSLPGLTYRNFGFMPVCPLGGDYALDRTTGEVRNSVYGSENYPIIRINQNNNGMVPEYLKKFFSSEELRVELEFTPEGIKTKIVSR